MITQQPFAPKASHHLLEVSTTGSQVLVVTQDGSVNISGPLSAGTVAATVATTGTLQADAYRMNDGVFVTIGTHYTLNPADDGRLIRVDLAGTSVTVFCAGTSLPSGFNTTLYQQNTAQIVVAGVGGGTIRNRQGHTMSAGQYALISLVKIGNDFVLTGDTQ